MGVVKTFLPRRKFEGKKNLREGHRDSDAGGANIPAVATVQVWIPRAESNLALKFVDIDFQLR